MEMWGAGLMEMCFKKPQRNIYLYFFLSQFYYTSSLFKEDFAETTWGAYVDLLTFIQIFKQLFITINLILN